VFFLAFGFWYIFDVYDFEWDVFWWLCVFYFYEFVFGCSFGFHFLISSFSVFSFFRSIISVILATISFLLMLYFLASCVNALSVSGVTCIIPIASFPSILTGRAVLIGMKICCRVSGSLKSAFSKRFMIG